MPRQATGRCILDWEANRKRSLLKFTGLRALFSGCAMSRPTASSRCGNARKDDARCVLLPAFLGHKIIYNFLFAGAFGGLLQRVIERNKVHVWSEPLGVLLHGGLKLLDRRLKISLGAFHPRQQIMRACGFGIQREGPV